MIFKQSISFENNYCQLIYLYKVINILKEHLNDEYQLILTSFLDIDLPDFDINKKNIVVFISDEIGIIPSWYLKPDIIFRQYNDQSLCDYIKIFPIPCGFNGPIIANGVENDYWGEKEKKPLLERDYDLFYSGQSSLHRRQLVNNVNKIKGKYKSNIKETGGFRQGFTTKEYYENLNNTKIAFIPDGVSIPESFRYVEAFESNCIAITTYPIKNKNYRLWYYENSPAVFLDKWNELNSNLIDKLLDKDILIEYFEKNKIYYNNYLSTEAVAKYMLDKINF
jgi:hypothetical protein